MQTLEDGMVRYVEKLPTICEQVTDFYHSPCVDALSELLGLVPPSAHGSAQPDCLVRKTQAFAATGSQEAVWQASQSIAHLGRPY